MRLALTAPLLVLCALPGAASGQLGFLDRIFGNVTDVTASRLFGNPYGRLGAIADSQLVGLGIEVTLDAITLSRKSNKCPPPDSTRKREATLTEVRVQHVTRDGADSTLVYKIKPIQCEDDPRWDIELGFGYTQMQGIRGAFGVQGSIEELPFTGLYLNYHVSKKAVIYGGPIGGLAQLKNFRANGDSGGLVFAAASTFEYGAVVGASVGVKNLSLFVESAWIVREFDGITWSATGSKEAFVPTALQAPIRLSTQIIAVGVQIKVERAKE